MECDTMTNEDLKNELAELKAVRREKDEEIKLLNSIKEEKKKTEVSYKAIKTATSIFNKLMSFVDDSEKKTSKKKKT